MDKEPDDEQGVPGSSSSAGPPPPGSGSKSPSSLSLSLSRGGDDDDTGSFLSFTSGNSVYVTAPTSLGSSLADFQELETSAASDLDPFKKRFGKSGSYKPGGGGGGNGNGGQGQGAPEEDGIIQGLDCIDGGKRDKPELVSQDSFSSTTSTLADERDSLNSDDMNDMIENEDLLPSLADSIRTAEESRTTSEESDRFSNGNENGNIELKADVSRICNDIAEAIQPDTRKKAEINLAIIASTNRGTVDELRKLAVSDGGLLSNAFRRKTWPLLMGMSQDEIEASESKRIPKNFQNVSKQIKDLVHMDVARVLKRFPPGLSDPQQDHLQSYLTSLICSVLNRNPSAYYYQGFHDISLTFLLVFISQSVPYVAYLCLNKIIETSLGPFMEKTMEATHDLIHIIFAIIEEEDKDLFKKIVVDSKCPVAFCLPWVLTWFSHTLPSDNDVFRLYDFILGCTGQVNPPSLIPIFISASLVLRNSWKIKNSVRIPDLATMHHTLAQLPSEQASLEPWLCDSLKLMKKFSGKESQLLLRAKEIKVIQNRIWDEDNSSTSRNRNRRGGIITNVGRFVFIRYRWYAAAVIILGTSYLIQAKYGVASRTGIRALFKRYTPVYLQDFLGPFIAEWEFEGVQLPV